MNLLVVESSFRQQGSLSRLLTGEFLQNWRAKFGSDNIEIDDLRLNPPPHLNEDLFGSWLLDPAKLTFRQQIELKRANEIIASVKKADVLVFGAPLYNFNISSTLKAWIDHFMRVGETFVYTKDGGTGYLKNKKALVLSAVGGIYEGDEGDFQVTHLRYVLAFNGITDTTCIKAQGLDLGEDIREQALNKAYKEIKQFVDSL